jgi:thiol-disulfide isomerase/thioredoxin
MSAAFYVSYVLMWALLLFQGVLLLLVYRHFGFMALGRLEGVQRDGLAVGESAPAVSGVTAEGVDVAWNPVTDRPSLLLFVAPDCEPCKRILPAINGLSQGEETFGLSITAIVAGPRDAAIRVAEKFRPLFTFFSEDGSGAFERYRVRVTPFAFVISTDGKILSKGLCSDTARLNELLAASGVNHRSLEYEPQISLAD